MLVPSLFPVPSPSPAFELMPLRAGAGMHELSLGIVDGGSVDLFALDDSLSPRCDAVFRVRESNVLECMARAVEQRRGTQVLHIFCHGEPGALLFGGTRLDLDALEENADALARIGASLDGGDLFLYGCRVALGAAGTLFVRRFADLTGANIRAATGDVGCASQGGTWDLDHVQGNPRALPFRIPEFHGLLASGILQNRYVRFGYSDDGTLGYGGTTRPGIQYDPTGTRTFLDTADSLTPGTPFEGFTIAIGNTRFHENNSRSGGAAEHGTHILETNVTTQGADTWGAITFVTEVGGLRVTQVLTLAGVDSKAITVNVSVENIGGATLNDVQYARFLDPDVDYNGLPGSTASTLNARGSADIEPENIVLATGPVSGRVIGYYSDSSVTHNTAVTNWSDVPADYLAGGVSRASGDHVIGIGFDLGDLSAGQSRSFTLAVAFAASAGDLSTSLPNVNAAPVLSDPESVPVLADGISGAVYVIRPTDLLAGISDPDGDPMSVVALSSSAGELSLMADGTWTLTTRTDFSGAITLNYAVSDGHGGLLSGLTRSLAFAPNLALPIAVADTFTLVRNAPGIALDVLANDIGGDAATRRITHINDVAITVGQAVAIAGGTALLSVGGTIVFRPDADFTGQVVFNYQFTDSTGGVSTGTVTGSVARQDHLPAATGDHFLLPADDSPVTIDVVANDSHPGGADLTITEVQGHAISAGKSISVRGGHVTLDANNTLVFTRDDGASGPVAFSYTAVDSEGHAASALVSSSSILLGFAPGLEAALSAAHLPRVANLGDLVAIASVIAPGVFGSPDLSPGQGYQAPLAHGLDLESTSTDVSNLFQALLSIVAVQTSGLGQSLLAADASGGLASTIDQSLLFQSVLASPREVRLDFGPDGTVFSSPGSAIGAWSRAFAQQMLDPDVSADVVRQSDGQSQAQSHQADMAAGSLISVGIDGATAGAPHAALSSLFGLVDFVSSDGTSAVEVARTVMVAQTAGGSDGQSATVTLRQNGMNAVEVAFYRVDDYSGSVDGLRPGDAGYDTASAARAYQTSDGGSWIAGAGYGARSTAEVLGINSGDLIVMRLRSESHDFYAFSQGNEIVNGQHVNHIWNYGLNTWGWEDLMGGGDQDFNDLVVRLDFIQSADATGV